MGNELSPTEQKARMFCIAVSDISAAREACDLLIKYVKDKSDSLYTPLLAATIVYYARPFTKNRGYEALDVQWGKFQNKDLQEMHDYLLELRHKVIAHSDADGRRVHFTREDTTIGKRINSVMVVSDSLAVEHFQRVRETCEDLLGRLQTASDDALDRLGLEETRQKP